LKQHAFVIGNGNSRRSIELSQLKEKGIVYGCNALYREFEPDYLIAVDTKMILEINKAGYQHSHEVWTNPNKAYTKFTGFKYFNPSKGWSSGPPNTDIYVLGFDYQGIDDKVNNVYAGTLNYKKTHERATYHGNWLKQTIINCQKFPKKRYIRVVGSNPFIPNEFAKLSNLEHIDVEEFKKIFALS
jgi:hypothetical protein